MLAPPPHPISRADRPVLATFVATDAPQRRRPVLRILPLAGVETEARRARERRVLSARELEVLTLAARGLTGAQIAEHLHLAESTIETHVRRAAGALGAHNRVHAVALAIGQGLIAAPRA